MRVARLVLSFVVILGSSPGLNSQQSTASAPRDPQAAAALQNAVAAMGGTVPSDSTASGSISLVAGSDKQSGSIQIQTRGTDQTLVQIRTASGTKQTVFSHGVANNSDYVAAKTRYPLELAATSQSALFPLPLLSGMLFSADSAYQYVGTESINGSDCNHVRTWSTYSSQPALQSVSSFTGRDIWIDAKTNLPTKIAYLMRAGSGAKPAIPLEITFSDYRSVSGVLYPFQISQSLNGTPWLSVTISSVSFNTGLTDSTFSTF